MLFYTVSKLSICLNLHLNKKYKNKVSKKVENKMKMSHDTCKKQIKMLDCAVRIWYFMDVQKINVRKGEMQNVK